ncbi:MAG TPA: NYN domain-containing protein [Pyrinomonadaceae bacterium]|nr:NYN domain-containing protein [Pyrinomonadaceae bacterium]
MKTESSSNVVAVYFDFENLHAALYEREWGGSKSYSDNRYSQQDALVNIKAVLDYARSIGDIAIKRAYNNWQWFSRYREMFNNAGLDLIQIYPKGARAKNGADIRLALDALEDVLRYPRITHVIIISSDSDFVSLAQKLKQSGVSVIGIGVQQATNAFWAQSCDEFKYYDTLLGLTEDVPPATEAKGLDKDEEEEPAVKTMSLEEARKLMLDALRRVTAQKGEDQVPRGTLKVMMKRMDSTFDEANLGFFNFGSFLKAFSDVVEDITDDSGGKVRLRNSAEQTGAKSDPEPPVSPVSEQDYALILKRGNVHHLPTPWWREAVLIVDEIFRDAPQRQIASFDDLEGKLEVRLNAAGLDSDPSLVHKLRGFLFALRQFHLDKDRQVIGLKVAVERTLLHSVEREIVRRIVRYAAPPIDVFKVASLLYGENAPNRLEDARELIYALTPRTA